MSISGTRFTAVAAFPPGAAVSVCSVGTTTKVSLYATASGTTSLANPVAANANGDVTFFAAFGTVDLVVDEGGVAFRITVPVAPNPSLAWPG